MRALVVVFLPQWAQSSVACPASRHIETPGGSDTATVLVVLIWLHT